MMKSLLSLLLILLFTAPLAAEIRIKDALDREIVLPSRVERVVSLHGSLSEIICALGEEKRIIAATVSDDFPAVMKSKPKVGRQNNPSLEKILSFKPDLILISATRKSQLKVIKKLEQVGIKVVAAHSRSFDELNHNIRLIGKILNVEKKSEALIQNMDQRLRKVEDRLKEMRQSNKGKAVRVFYEVKANPILFSRGKRSFVQSVIEKAGCENIVKSPKSMLKYPVESLLQENPDLYVIQKGPMNKHPRDPSKEAILKPLKAVKEKRVVLVDEKLFSRPGPRSVLAVETLAYHAYPDWFSAPEVGGVKKKR